MLDIKALFEDAEKDSYTTGEVVAKFAGMKLADINEGEYVGKDKFTAEVKKAKDTATAAVKELDDLKAATDGDDGLKKQVATLTEQNAELTKTLDATTGNLTAAQRKATVAEKAGHLTPKLQRLAFEDAEALVTETTDFPDALAKVLADDPDYAPPAEDDGAKPTPPVKVGSGAPAKGAPTNSDPAFDAFQKGFRGEDAE